MKMVKKNMQFLSFNILVLKLCLLWSEDTNEKRMLKDSALILSLMPCYLPILVDFISQLHEGVPNLTEAVENMIALSCIMAMVYMVICFLQNRNTIFKLMIRINTFNKYMCESELKKIDEKANLSSKMFMFYGILGNVVYMLMPQLSVKKCHRTEKMIEDGIPCGLIVRSSLPFKFDYFPVLQLVFIDQLYTCTIVSIVVIVFTMLLCGLLMHILNQLKNLRNLLQNLEGSPKWHDFVYIIQYHIEIIDYAKAAAEAFSSMLLFYITLTSVVLSVLCFEIIMVNEFEDSLRFSFHLVGWLVILLSICYYGQLVIDESCEVAYDIYALNWFNFPIDIQKMIQTIIMRSHKPLVFNASGMGILSLPAFLKVLSSAYSFFTLLLNMK